jgi:hypothetical protein
MIPRCPACGHKLRDGGRLTPRELDVLAAWWMVGTVKGAAVKVGVAEQRAKNLLARARIRNGVSTNDDLLEMHFVDVRSLVGERMQHNNAGGEVA